MKLAIINNKMDIVLASSSPRRKKILENMGLKFQIIPSDFEEFLESLDFSYEKIEELAYNKASAVLDEVSDLALVLSADTVVVLENKILGKPQNETEAVEMLSMLSGKRHFVVTSICVINSQDFKKKILSTTSFVEFETLSDELIKAYVQQCKPLDKAGAYGIQELPDGFVKSVEGSFENIIGLCPNAVTTILNQFGFSL